MSYLLDTNVVSESMRRRPNAGVMTLLSHLNDDDAFISVVTITDIRTGIERLAAGQKRNRLDQWLRDELIQRFTNRILPIDTQIADACGRLVARSQRAGRPIDPRDAYIAATAEVHSLTLVTRNTSDFEPVLKAMLNPWN